MVTTDAQDEQLDVLDGGGRPTGRRKRRGDVHRDGDWHAALHVWVGAISTDGQQLVLFQRRSQTKDTWPGAIDVAVGGHVQSGETLPQAIREAEEEIGLGVSFPELVPLGRRFFCGSTVADNEVQEAFAVRCDLPLRAYRLHPDEVSGVLHLPVAATLALFEHRVASVRGTELRRGRARPGPVEARIADFAGIDDDGYARHALQGLADVLAGRAPAPFELR